MPDTDGSDTFPAGGDDETTDKADGNNSERYPVLNDEVDCTSIPVLTDQVATEVLKDKIPVLEETPVLNEVIDPEDHSADGAG